MESNKINKENKFAYDKAKIHKSFSFGPAGSGAKTAMCKAYHHSEFEMIDLKICKRNWKNVTCPTCLDIKARTH